MNVRSKSRPALPKTAKVQLRGPKFVLPQGKINITVELNHTWNQVLTGIGLPLAPNGITFVSTQDYTPTCPERWKGRRAELNETVEEFIKGFKVNFSQERVYNVRLCSDMNSHAPRNKSTGKRRLPPTSTSCSRDASDATAAKRLIPDPNCEDSVKNTSIASQPAKNNTLNLPILICLKSDSDDDDGQSNGDSGISNEELENETICENERKFHPKHCETTDFQEPKDNNNVAYPAAKNIPSRKISLRGIRREKSHELSSDSSDDDEQSNKSVPKSRNLDSYAMPPPPPPPRISDVVRGVQRQAAAGVNAFLDNITGQPNVGAATHDYRGNGHQEVREYQGAHENEEPFDDQEEPVHGGNHLFPPMASVRTTASEDEYQLNLDGIVMENMEATVEEGLRQFDNGYILRVRNELEMLLEKDKKRYNRIFLKMPLAMNLLEKVFLR